MNFKNLVNLTLCVTLLGTPAFASDCALIFKRISSFFGPSSTYRDRDLGWPQGLAHTQDIHELREFNGEPVVLFLILDHTDSGRHGMARVGIWRDEIVTAKIIKDPRSSGIYNAREMDLIPLLHAFFISQGWPSPVPEIIGYDFHSQLLLKKFKPGISLRQFRKRTDIPGAIREKGERTLAVLADRLRIFSHESAEYQEWKKTTANYWSDLDLSAGPVGLELEWKNNFSLTDRSPPDQNLIYFNGEWSLIDP